MIALLFLLLIGAHARPPQDLLDDDAHWRAGLNRLRAGPPGCWLFSGDGAVTLTLETGPRDGAPPETIVLRNPVRFVGKLNSGTWTRIDAWPVDDAGAETAEGLSTVLPTVARLSDADRSLDDSPLDGLADKIKESGSIIPVYTALSEAFLKVIAGQFQDYMDLAEGETEIAFAQWDEEGAAVLYERQLGVTFHKTKTIDFKARFHGEHTAPDRASILWPKKFNVGTWPAIAYIRGAQSHMSAAMVDGELLPTGESLSLRFRAMGTLFGFEQTLRFSQAARCPTDAPSAPRDSPAEQDQEQEQEQPPAPGDSPAEQEQEQERPPAPEPEPEPVEAQEPEPAR